MGRVIVSGHCPCDLQETDNSRALDREHRAPRIPSRESGEPDFYCVCYLVRGVGASASSVW